MCCWQTFTCSPSWCSRGLLFSRKSGRKISFPASTTQSRTLERWSAQPGEAGKSGDCRCTSPLGIRNEPPQTLERPIRMTGKPHPAEDDTHAEQHDCCGDLVQGTDLQGKPISAGKQRQHSRL